MVTPVFLGDIACASTQNYLKYDFFEDILYIYSMYRNVRLVSKFLLLKGIVQRKLRCVESNVNQWVMLQYCGAGHYFLILKGHHFVFCIKRFAAT